MESKKCKIALCIIIFLSLCSFLGAQGDGGQAGSFLRYGIGSRAMGMGRAFVAVSDDASGIYWNPAGLVGAKRIEFTSLYSNLYYDSRFANVGVVFPRPSRSLKRGLFQWLFGPSTAMAFGWVGLSMTGFEQRTESMKLLGEFGYSENAFMGAWAREDVGSWGILRYGITCKLVNQSYSGGAIPLTRNGFALYSRVGFNNRMEGTALGMGLSMPFSNSALVRVDYSYGFHQYLPEDNRFFLTIQAGRALNAEYFRSVSQREEIEKKQMRKYLLRVLTEYPNDFVDEAVEELVTMDDSVKTRRYFDLTGGLGRAGWLFQEAKMLLKKRQIGKARRKAAKAADEYTPLYYKPDHPLVDTDLMDYGESLIIAHQVEDAIPVLKEIEQPSIRSYYLRGICEKAAGNLDGAIEMFKEAVNLAEEEDLNNMVGLSLFHWGESLVGKEEYQAARQYFETFLKNYSERLGPDYPRYPIYTDGYILDDAQYLIGLCKLMEGQHSEGIASLMKTQRFYPGLEYGREIGAQAGRLIELLKTNEFEQLDNLARQFWTAYQSTHQWPPVQ